MGELVVIFMSIIVMLVVIGLSVNGIVQKVLDHKRAMREGGTSDAASQARIGEIADRTLMIEDRLQVLERLATDRGTLLADEIDALRLSAAITKD